MGFEFWLAHSAKDGEIRMKKKKLVIKLELLKNVFRMSETEQKKVSEFAQFAAFNLKFVLPPFQHGSPLHFFCVVQ